MLTIDFSKLNIKPNDLILDLGCGEGRHTLGSHLLHPEAKTIGLDLSLKDVHTAKKRHNDFIQSNTPNNETEIIDNIYCCANAYKLPFVDNSFDHIICSEVLEHLEDYSLAIKEIQRILKPGGIFALSVPRFWPEKICWKLSSAYYSVPGGHVRIFNAKKLSQKIEKSSFLFHKKHWAHALHSPYWWLRCLFWQAEESKQHWLVKQYHKILVWDLLKKPWLTQTLEKHLNPIMGKSVVMYFEKISKV